jgi:sporulation protein YlmC with PRC-barrel domain
MKASKLTGMPVISIADGIKAGQVADLRIAATSPQVQALMLKTGREHTVVPFESIRTIGPDAIMIESLDVLCADDELASGDVVRHFTSLVGRETAGDDGRYLGDVRDLEVDPSSGRIDAILLHRGGVMGIGGEDVNVPGAHLHAFGPKLLTVAPPVTDSDRSVAPADSKPAQHEERASVGRS